MLLRSGPGFSLIVPDLYRTCTSTPFIAVGGDNVGVIVVGPVDHQRQEGVQLSPQHYHPQQPTVEGRVRYVCVCVCWGGG